MILKFRWYDKSNNEMITTEDISNGLGGDYFYILQDEKIGLYDTELEDNCLVSDEAMQFTGLADKNGKDIFEGDIVDDMFDCGQLHIIYYNEEKAAFCKKAVKASPMLGRTDMPISISVETTTGGKVIGNIHQHSHLLDKGE